MTLWNFSGQSWNDYKADKAKNTQQENLWIRMSYQMQMQWGTNKLLDDFSFIIINSKHYIISLVMRSMIKHNWTLFYLHRRNSVFKKQPSSGIQKMNCSKNPQKTCIMECNFSKSFIVL